MSVESRRRSACYYRTTKSEARDAVVNVTVPDDVARIIGDGSPCFMCESAGPCRHRPWMVAS